MDRKIATGILGLAVLVMLFILSVLYSPGPDNVGGVGTGIH